MSIDQQQSDSVKQYQNGEKGLDMSIALALKGFELEWQAFDAVDAKSSGAISYVALAGTIFGFITVRGQHPAPATWVTCAALALFVFGIVAALTSLRTREFAGLPGAVKSLEYWEYHGDADSLPVLLQLVEDAEAELHDLVCFKSHRLHWSYGFVVAGFAAIITATIISGLAPPAS